MNLDIENHTNNIFRLLISDKYFHANVLINEMNLNFQQILNLVSTGQ